VPIDGFSSITVYKAEGYLEPNQDNAYAVNNISAKKGMDGTARSPSSSAGATGKFPIACRS
jgi:hypothetical protein